MPTGETLRILTLNTWGIIWPVGRDVIPRARAIGERFPSLDVDVIALQEVWTEDARGVFARAGQAAGFAQVWPESGQDLRGGLMLLSRYPIEHSHFTPYELGGIAENLHHSDYWGGKGFAIHSLATPFGSVHFLNTHLHAAYRSRENDEYIGHRTGQIIQIASALRDIEGPLIAVGDFNFAEEHEEYTIFTGLSGVRDSALDLERRAPTTMPSSEYLGEDREPINRIDYVFYRSGLQRSAHAKSIDVVFHEGFKLEGRSMQYSDHAGLRAEFQISSSGKPLPPVRYISLSLAAKQLKRGSAAVLERQGHLRRVGIAALGVPALAYLVLPPSQLSRRRFISAAAILFGGSALRLSEVFRPEELAGFAEAQRQLAVLRASLG